MARNRKPILTAEEEAWAAGWDERTQQMLELLTRRRAAIEVRAAREARRRDRPCFLRWFPS